MRTNEYTEYIKYAVVLVVLIGIAIYVMISGWSTNNIKKRNIQVTQTVEEQTDNMKNTISDEMNSIMNIDKLGL